MLRLVQLEGLGKRRPDQLSGGQKQRVALARALAKRPKLLLLDEPLAALDRKLREQTQFELKEVQRRLGTAFVVVTHDQEEASVMASRIAVMRAGKLEQIGTPAKIYARPASRFVAEFFGDINILDGDVQKRTRTAAATDESTGRSAATAVRPERIVVESEAAAASAGLPAIVDDLAFRGSDTLYRVQLNPAESCAWWPRIPAIAMRFARAIRCACKFRPTLAFRLAIDGFSMDSARAPRLARPRHSL